MNVVTLSVTEENEERCKKLKVKSAEKAKGKNYLRGKKKPRARNKKSAFEVRIHIVTIQKRCQNQASGKKIAR